MRPNRRILMIFPQISYAKAIPQHSKTALSRDVPTEIPVVDTTRNRANTPHALMDFLTRTQHYLRDTHAYAPNRHILMIFPRIFHAKAIPQHNEQPITTRIRDSHNRRILMYVLAIFHFCLILHANCKIVNTLAYNISATLSQTCPLHQIYPHRIGALRKPPTLGEVAVAD